MKNKKIIKKLILAVFAILATLILAEFAVRLVLPPQRHLPLYEKTPDGNHILRANLKLRYTQREFSHDIITNSWGFRNKREIPNSNLIVFVGDSFTFGTGVDEELHYVYLFDKLLNWREKKYNVCNAGVAGHATVNEYLYIKTLLERKLDVKQIFLQVDISDFNENVLFPIYEVKDGRLVFNTRERNGLAIRLLNFLGARSELVNLIYYRFVHSSVLKGYTSSLLRLKYFEINLVDKNLRLFEREKDTESVTKLERFKKHFEDIAQLCKKSGIKLYVYYIPILQEVYDSEYRKALRTYGLSEKDIDLKFINSYIKRLSEENDASFIDVRDDILRFKNEILYYPIDQHLNREGNLVTGISLYKGYANDKKQ